MAQWTEALAKLNAPEPPRAGSPGMGAGNVPYAPGIFRMPSPGPAPGGAPPPSPGAAPMPAPGGPGQGPPPGPPPGGGGPPGMGAAMGPNPFQFQAEVLSTLMSAVMASIERAKRRRAGGVGSGY